MNGCGEEIAEIVRKMERHKDADMVIPLYRSAIAIRVVEDEHNRGIEIDGYGDPHWMGDEITEENIQSWHDAILIVGQRSGVDVLLNGVDVKGLKALNCPECGSRLFWGATEGMCPECGVDYELKKVTKKC